MLFATPRLADEEHAVLELIREQWKRLKWLLQERPAPWTGYMRQWALARGIRGSNSIEGFKVSDDDAAAAVEGDLPFDTTAETLSWRAVVSYREAMSHALQQAADPDSSIDPSLIRSLHYLMMKYTPEKHPGSWRPGPIFVHDGRTNKVVYEGPPREQINGLVGELTRAVSAPKFGDESPLIQAAMAHLNLAMIHPFSDGNGRMARCLQTLVLAKAGVFDPIFCSVEEWLGVQVNTDEYYSVLAHVGGGSWQPKRDARPWTRLMLKAHYQQAATTERRQVESREVWGAVEDELRALGFPERATGPLFEASFGRAIRNSRYRHHAEVNDSTATRDLKALVQAGLLVRSGEKRGSQYRASDRLKALRDKHRQPKEIPDPFTLISKS